MATVLSWEAAYRRKEIEAFIACAQSIDRLNATVEHIAREEGLSCANMRTLPGTTRPLMGPVEARLRIQLGLLHDSNNTVCLIRAVDS